MDIPIRIAKMNLMDREPNEKGERLLAVFDLQVPFVTLRSCILVKTKTGHFNVMPPDTRNKEGKAMVTLCSPIKAIILKALETYRVMGGEYGEWPEPPASLETGATVPLDLEAEKDGHEDTY